LSQPRKEITEDKKNTPHPNNEVLPLLDEAAHVNSSVMVLLCDVFNPKRGETDGVIQAPAHEDLDVPSTFTSSLVRQQGSEINTNS
jgi:hypothetical protein